MNANEVYVLYGRSYEGISQLCVGYFRDGHNDCKLILVRSNNTSKCMGGIKVIDDRTNEECILR